ncbi:hypothetical protein ACFL3M_02105, partial [Patescibacteria group bacterium]
PVFNSIGGRNKIREIHEEIFDGAHSIGQESNDFYLLEILGDTPDEKIQSIIEVIEVLYEMKDQDPVRIRKPYRHTTPIFERDRKLRSIAGWALFSGVCFLLFSVCMLMWLGGGQG